MLRVIFFFFFAGYFLWQLYASGFESLSMSNFQGMNSFSFTMICSSLNNLLMCGLSHTEGSAVQVLLGRHVNRAQRRLQRNLESVINI